MSGDWSGSRTGSTGWAGRDAHQWWGSGLSGDIRDPLKNIWKSQAQYQGQPYDAWKTDFSAWRQSEPFQSWMSQKPQRPQGGWASPSDRSTAYGNWYGSIPAAPWGNFPTDWASSLLSRMSGSGRGGDYRSSSGGSRGTPTTMPNTPTTPATPATPWQAPQLMQRELPPGFLQSRFGGGTFGQLG